MSSFILIWPLTSELIIIYRFRHFSLLFKKKNEFVVVDVTVVDLDLVVVVVIVVWLHIKSAHRHARVDSKYEKSLASKF